MQLRPFSSANRRLVGDPGALQSHGHGEGEQQRAWRNLTTKTARLGSEKSVRVVTRAGTGRLCSLHPPSAGDYDDDDDDDDDDDGTTIRSNYRCLIG